MDRDGTDVRLLVRSYRDGALHVVNPPQPETPVDVIICSFTRVVPEPWANPGLVQDCETLLRMRDRLSGSAPLNWNIDTPIRRWEGVMLGGSPLRVHRLTLDYDRMPGTLPPELGQLIELRRLDLAGGIYPASRLAGTLPPELGNLTKLESLKIGPNFLSGSIPPELGGLFHLQTLEIGPNFLSGCVPEGLSRLWVERTELERCTSTEATSP
jgi:hypothetical protein